MSQTCPHCNDTLQIPHRGPHNVECYGNPVKVVTECCNKMIRISRTIILNYSIYDGPDTEDDWGVPLE